MWSEDMVQVAPIPPPPVPWTVADTVSFFRVHWAEGSALLGVPRKKSTSALPQFPQRARGGRTLYISEQITENTPLDS